MNEEGGEDYKEMLNTMKVEEFLERREEMRVRRVFGVLRAVRKSDGFKRHYEMSLYCKVVKGFMMEQMRVNLFRERLESVYVGILMGRHFQAFKRFRGVMEEEREGKVLEVKSVRLRFCVKNMVRNMKENGQRKKDAEKGKEKVDQTYHLKFKTQQHFRPVREQQPQPSAPRTYLSRPLEDSRKSAYSAFSATDFPSRRKYTTVKQLPSRPNLESILEGSNKERKVESSKNEEKKEEIDSRELQIASSIKQEQKVSFQAPKIQQSRAESFQQEPSKSELPKPKPNYPKQKIISLIAQLKLLQITKISEIIEDYSSSLKAQSLINEKNYLQLSKTTLKSIIESQP